MMSRLLFLLVLLSGTTALGHASHSTLTEVGVEEGRLEVALQLRMADLDVAFTHTKIKAGTFEEAVRKLVTSHFKLKGTDGKSIPFSWVGIEDEGFQVWVYLQWPLEEPYSAHSFSNTLFYEVESRTVHIAHFKGSEGRGSLTFHQGQDWKKLPVLKGKGTRGKPVENSPDTPDRGKTEAP